MYSRDDKPKFRTARGAADTTLQMRPPFRFEGVSVRVFPLKANMSRLRAFCDSYLNKVLGGTEEFRPFLPYVGLLVLDYGKMSPAITNLGWVAQHEVAFTVPLEWYREQNGRMVFADWVCVSPFIFVDDGMSLTTGREVYGWPKVEAWLDPDIAPWLSHPRNRPQLMTLSTMVFPRVYAGKRQRPEVLLEIDHELPLTFSQFPPDPFNPFNPLLSIPKAIVGALSTIGDFVEILLGLPILGSQRTFDRQSVLGMMRKGFERVAGLLPDFSRNQTLPRQSYDVEDLDSSNLYLNHINLKQFRDAEASHFACYQALVSSKMDISQYNSGGLLGDVDLLWGEPTGGFRIKIHRYTAQPIIESLGLEVAEEWEIPDHSVAILKPLYPFWVDLDLHYGKGETICWRTKTSDWHYQATSQSPALQAQRENAHQEVLYNTAQGAAVQEITGPFHFPDVTLRVFPLLADKTCLKKLCDDYLNDSLPDEVRFEPFGSYVYLIVKSYGKELGKMWSETNNLGWWAEHELAFSIPVKWYKGQKLVSLAMVSPFVFADLSTAAITDREVNGRPTVEASLETPTNAWMKESGAMAEYTLLTLKTEVLPALNLDQQAEERVLVEIQQGDVRPENAEVGWRFVGSDWGEELLRDHRRKIQRKHHHTDAFDNLKALALEILAHGEPMNEIAFKQFRDADTPDCACYQALVQSRKRIERIHDLREFEENMHIRIHRYPSQPIVETLGLKVKTTETKGASVVEIFQPLRSFSMRVSMKEDLGKNIYWRAGTKLWESASRDRPELDSLYFEEDGKTKVGQGSIGGPQHLQGDAHAWLRGSLTGELKALGASLGPHKWQTLLASLGAEALKLFSTPPASDDEWEALGDSFGLDKLVWLVDLLESQALQLQILDNRIESRRLTRAEGKRAVEQIEEPHMVLESILSQEWEHWGTPRWQRKSNGENIDQKPDFCIRSDSVGPHGKPFFREGCTTPDGWYSEEPAEPKGN